MGIQEYLQQFMQNAASLQLSSELYQSAVDSIRAVAKMTEPLLVKKPDGSYPELDAKLRKELYQAYKKATESILSFRDSLDPDELEQAAGAMEPLEAINHLLTVDMHAMLALKPETQITYREFVAQSREVTLQLAPGGEAKSVGGVMSSRLPLSYTDEFGKERKGLFTEARTLNDEDIGVVTRQNLRELGIDDASTIEGRNVVFSRVAELLGIGKQIARAVSMTVEVNGEKKKGVFMDAVEGVDLGRMDPETVKKEYKDGIQMSNGALKQLSDIQMLDFILGNKDRHAGNMIYDIGKDENGKAVLRGVTGIDNDYSLGSENGDRVSTRYSMSISDITFCSASMAEKLSLMTDEMMLLSMQDQQLSSEEKNAAVNRLHQVQEKLRNREITIIQDGEWLAMQKEGKLEPPEDGFNLICMMGQVLQPEGLVAGAQQMQQMREANSEDSGEIRFEKATRVEKEGYIDFSVECAQKKTSLPDPPAADVGAKEVEPESRTYFGAYQALTKKESFFRGSTEKFKTMVRDLRALGTLCERLPAEMSDDELSRYHSALVKLRASVDAYVDYKKDNLNGAVAEDRYRNAQALQRFVSLRVEALEASPERLYRILTADECRERVAEAVAKGIFRVDKNSAHKLGEIKNRVKESEAFQRIMADKDLGELRQLGLEAANRPTAIVDRYIEASSAAEREKQSEQALQPVAKTDGKSRLSQPVL